MNDDEQVEETTEEEQVEGQEEAEEPNPQVVALQKQVSDLQAMQQRQPAPTSTAPELIEGTNIPKPDGYELWPVDRQFDHIATVRSQGMMQMSQMASRTARAIEADADGWYKPYMQDVIDSCDPRWLALGRDGQGLSDEEKKGLHTLAKGKALEAGKYPNQTTKTVPGASPSGNRQATSHVSSEVETVLADMKAAGYDKVADSASIKAILAGKA